MKSRAMLVLALASTICLLTLGFGQRPRAAAMVNAGTTTRVSVSSDGTQGNDLSWDPTISADGRYVAFFSWASNLVTGDTNSVGDIFVHDRQTGVTTRVSISSNGTQGNERSYEPAISADGRYVAFYSYASNLVSDDTNNRTDIFVHDRNTGVTTLVSVSSDGAQGGSNSSDPAISADGRYVAFSTSSRNLVPGDTKGSKHIFIHDRNTGETTLVSVSSDGTVGYDISDQSDSPAISADGRYVAFRSSAAILVPGDTNGKRDIFVHDRQTGQTTRVSVSSDGAQGNDDSFDPAISADGRYVAFVSEASNLVSGDTNGRRDVFVHDRQTGETTRVSVSSGGTQGNGYSAVPAISADGRNVAFQSYANNLVPGDTNGTWDIFVHDRQTGETTRVSIGSEGIQGNDVSVSPAISADGRYVAFRSHASNLVTGDTNGREDIFVHDRNGQTPNPYSISGKITTQGGTPISGVTVSAGSATSTTDANGNYTISGLTAGTYTVVPTLSGYTFTPESKSVAVPPIATGVNFVGSPLTYTISGKIKTQWGTPLPGVTVSAGSATGTTDASGNYTISGLTAGTYTVVPALSGYTFTPLTQSVTVPPGAGQIDFTAIKVAPINIGFKLNEDGYQFANYGGIASGEYSREDMVAMFGEEATCSSFSSEIGCLLKFSAIRWFIYVNSQFLEGFCFGMTTTALRFFTGIDDPSDFQPGVTKVFGLEKNNARRNIGWNHVLQFTSPYKETPVMGPPNMVLELAYQSLQSGSQQLYNLLIQAPPNSKGGHSVLPYAIEKAGGGKWRIMVYDNNTPGDTNRFILIDTLTNRFSSNLEGRPGEWTGGEEDGMIGIVPLSVLTRSPECPWCGNAQLRDGSSTATVMSRGMEDLLITDGSGHRVGYIGGELISEIPGAVVMPIFGGLVFDQEPIYYLPATSDYTIAISGSSGRSATENDITFFGPGFMAVAGNMSLDDMSHDTMIVDVGGQRVAYESSQAKQVDLWLTGGTNDNEQYKIVDADVGSGEEISLSHNSSGKIVISRQNAGGGTYTLELARIADGTEKIFIHRDIPLEAGGSHVIDMGSLTEENAEICLDVNSDGVIDNCRTLGNEIGGYRIFLSIILSK